MTEADNDLSRLYPLSDISFGFVSIVVVILNFNSGFFGASALRTTQPSD